MSGKVIEKTDCPSCRKQNLNHFEDGGKYCFTMGCDYNSKRQPITGTYQDLPERGISKKTCEFFDYKVGQYQGETCHYAIFKAWDSDSIHVRKIPKDFIWINHQKKLQLFGQHLWTKFDSLVITEGECDAMAVAEAFDLNQPVVSMVSGAGSVSYINDNLEFLNKFKSIILWLDNDDAGKDALQKVLAIIPEARIVHSQEKDANDTLLNCGKEEVRNLVLQARENIPESILLGTMLDQDFLAPEEKGYEIQYPLLNSALGGIKKGRLYVLGAGTGIGKSSFVKEISNHWIHKYKDLKIAFLYLEEPLKFTVQSYIALNNDVPAFRLSEDPTIISSEKFQTDLRTLKSDRFAFGDHFGSLSALKLFNILKYLSEVKKFDMIILDHISMVVSGMESSREGERKDIDILMTKLRALIATTGVTIIAISHLSRPEGKGYEEGRPVTLNSFRGSASICQLADVVISLERNQMSVLKDETVVRIVKNRVTGTLGVMDTLYYMSDKGRLLTLDKLM